MKKILQCTLDRLTTPIGTIMLAADADGNLRTVLFTEDKGDIHR